MTRSDRLALLTTTADDNTKRKIRRAERRVRTLQYKRKGR